MLLSISRTGTRVPCQTQYHRTGARHGADLLEVRVTPVQLIEWGNRGPERLDVLYYRAQLFIAFHLTCLRSIPRKNGSARANRASGIIGLNITSGKQEELGAGTSQAKL